MPEQYNGWTNYETWNVALWIDSDEYSQRHWQGMAEQLWEEAEDSKLHSREENAQFALAHMLQDAIDEGNPLHQNPSMYADLLGAALSEVNWQEIAENMLEGVDKEQEEDTEDDIEEVKPL